MSAEKAKLTLTPPPDPEPARPPRRRSGEIRVRETHWDTILLVGAEGSSGLTAEEIGLKAGIGPAGGTRKVRELVGLGVLEDTGTYKKGGKRGTAIFPCWRLTENGQTVYGSLIAIRKATQGRGDA